MSAETCQLTQPPFFQCCCNCVYHRPVHFHCCTEPKPTEEQKKAAGVTGRCVCGVRKGWACVHPESEEIYDNWGEHSCGCECYTERKPSPEAEAAREAFVADSAK